MQLTISSTEPARVLVEPRYGGVYSDVWLRKNIEKDVADNGMDGTPVEFWRANEVYFTVPGTPSEREIESDFDALWSDHSDNGESIENKVSKMLDEQSALRETTNDIMQAIGELGALVSEM